MKSTSKIKRFKLLTIIASIAIPLVVAVLFKVKIEIPNFNPGILPPIYATINGVTAVFLILALVAIKRKNRKIHEIIMKFCIVLSLVFLALYVLYHMTSDSTAFGGTGISKSIYLFILISHIILSVLVIPMVLFSYFHAWKGDFVKHKKLTRITWPIWFYVAVTGVIVYMMISPYYK